MPETSESQSLNTSTGSCGPVPSWGQGASLSAFGVFLWCYRTAGPSRGGPDQGLRFGLQSALARLSWRSRGRAARETPPSVGEQNEAGASRCRTLRIASQRERIFLVRKQLWFPSDGRGTTIIVQ